MDVSHTQIDVGLASVQGPSPANFRSPTLFAWLEQAASHDLDALGFGLVAMSPDGFVTHYNLAEASFSGLTPRRVVGRHFFTQVAPCANNVLVAQRYALEPALDDIVAYTFTFRMVPRPVLLRLLRQPDGKRMYLALENRPSEDGP